MTNCSYCYTKLFDNDRCCPKCGAPNLSPQKTEEKQKKRLFLVSVADVEVFSYPNYFCGRGKTLLDTSIECAFQEGQIRGTKNFYCHSDKISISITDFELENKIFLSKLPLFLKLISNIFDECGNICGNVQFIVENFRPKKIENNFIFGESFANNSILGSIFKTIY
jgi:hypothetical protein